MHNIPNELKSEIKAKATDYCKSEANGSRDDCSYCLPDYISGATEYATKLHHAEQEIAQLKQWKSEAAALLNPILEYGQSKEAGVPLGESITGVVLERCIKLHHASTLLKNVFNRYGEIHDWDRKIFNEIKTFLDGTK